MRKNYELRIDAKKLLTLSIAATMLVSAISFIGGTTKAFADPPTTVSVGSGQGTIVLTLHRIPQSNWDPCFAWTCQQPSNNGTITERGPGTWMYFDVYNSAGVEVGFGFANEDGTTITGLNVGETYRVQPTDCDNCSQGPEVTPHDVKFNNWADCSNPQWNVQERPFTITSATIYASAYYRYHPLSQPDSPLPCFAGVSAPVTKPIPQQAPAPAAHRVTVDMGDIYSALNLKQTIMKTILNGPAGKVTNVASVDSNVTTISAKMVPNISLSGVPIGPKGVIVNYKSLYDIQNFDSDGLITAMNTAPELGIDWNKLSDMQKAYLTLSLQYNTPTASMIPSTNLSGVPLGHSGAKVTYKSLYDIQNDDSLGLIKAMIATENLGIDWNTLSDAQKAYLALVLDYGLPSSQV